MRATLNALKGMQRYLQAHVAEHQPQYPKMLVGNELTIDGYFLHMSLGDAANLLAVNHKEIEEDLPKEGDILGGAIGEQNTIVLWDNIVGPGFVKSVRFASDLNQTLVVDLGVLADRIAGMEAAQDQSGARQGRSM
jgi:hypothetical protein